MGIYELAQRLSAPGAPTQPLAIASQAFNIGFVVVFGWWAL